MIKLVLQILTVLVALAGGMTVAAGGDGNNGNGNGSDKSKTEKSDRADKADKSDSKTDTSSKPAKEETPKPAKPNAKPAVTSVPAPEDVLPKTSVDAEIVLPEVMTEEALSLGEVRRALARISQGRMLDISLGEIDGRLVYEVTVLEAGNIARHVLIDAKSGLEVGDPR